MIKSRMIFVATCTVAVLTIFSLYSFVVVPMILPAKERSELIFDPIEENQDSALWEILNFPEDSWIFDKPGMISFSDGAGSIFWKDSEFHGNNQVQVSPCVILWFPNNHKELPLQEKYRQAIVLEAANHALLEFDGPISVITGVTPQLTRGQLNGIVTIRSQMKKPDTSDDIELVTSDVLFDFNRIQTRQQVDFRFGPNLGRGRNLTIEMANTDESQKGEMPNTIKRIELQELDVLRLYVANDDLNYSTGNNHFATVPYHYVSAYPQTSSQSELLQLRPESSGAMSSGTVQNRSQNGNITQVPQTRSTVSHLAPASNLSEVTVRCQGTVDLVADPATPEQWLLTFRKQVDVIRVNPQGAPSDQLNCHELLVTFGPKQEGNPIVPLPQNEAQKKTDDHLLANFGSLSPLKVKAMGDAGSLVTVRSPENKGFQAIGREMVLDLVRKELSLTQGNKDFSSPLSDEVTLLYDQFKIKGKSLYYGYESDNGPGKLDMPGGGTLEGVAGSDASKRFKLEWAEELKVLPDKNDPNLTLIQILGKPKVELAGVGTGTGDEILISCDMSKKKSAGTDGTSNIAAAGNFNAELKAIWMQRNVILKTDNGEILTNELEIHFQQPDTISVATRSVSRYPDPQLRNPPSTNGTNSKLSQMSIFGNSDGGKSTFTVRADKVEAMATIVGKDTVVDQILLTKNVKLDEKTSVPGLEAMHLSGQTACIDKPDTEQMTVGITGDNSVSGGHAMFQGRGVILLGANINIDREKNRFWVSGPGQLRISQQIVNAASSQSGSSGFDKLFATPGNSGSSNQAVIIGWTGSMDFNGRELTFIRDVNVNYSMMAINKSDSVRVRLTKPFRFFENNSTGEIEPEWVEIRGDIDLERDSYANNNGGQLTHDHIRLTAVEIFPITGAFRGLGPGSISSIFMDTNENASNLLPTGTSTVRSSPTTTNSTAPGISGLFGKGLKFIQCNFHHSVDGNYRTGQVTFNDRVVAMLCPAGSFRDVIDTNDIRQIVATGMLLECNTLEIVQPPQGGGNKTVDLKAEGNTRIELTYDHRYYIANADKLKLEQAKNLITLEGNRYSKVELYEAASMSAPTQKLTEGERVYFNPVTRESRGDNMSLQSRVP